MGVHQNPALPVGNRPLEIVGRDTLLVTGPGDSLLYFNLRSGKITRTTGTALLNGFCSQAVQNIVFETGSQGCFHHFADQIVYRRAGSDFKWKANAATGSEHEGGLTGYPHEFATSALDSFVRRLPGSLRVPPTIRSIGITAADYAQCRTDIQAFRAYVKAGKPDQGIEEKGFRMYQNDIDFHRLLELTDSVATISPETVDNLLYHTSNLVSTTTSWTEVRLVLKDGETLSISNRYYQPNSLHFPWTVTLSGYHLEKNAISVNQFIDAVYPNFLDRKSHADIVECFVKYLYGR